MCFFETLPYKGRSSQYRSVFAIDISFTGVQTAVSEMMDRAGFRERIGEEHFYWDAVAAIKALEVREYGSDYAD